MLLQFRFSNFLSFRDDTTLDLTPTRGKRLISHVLHAKKPIDKKSLRFAAIFGANASGKSNFVRAIAYIRDVVINDASFVAPGSIIGKFELDKESSALPMLFDVEFLTDNRNYRYTIGISDAKVCSERLDTFFEGAHKVVFERIQGKHIEVSNKLVGEVNAESLKEILKRIRDNETVLNFAHDRGIEHIDAAFRWFSEKLIVVVGSGFPSLLEAVRKYERLLPFISKKISEVDAGISHVELKTETAKLPKDLNWGEAIIEAMKGVSLTNAARQFSSISNDVEDIQFSKEGTSITSLLFHHRAANGASMPMVKMVESDGTKRLIDLLPLCYLAALSDHVIIIDELERSLHNLLFEWFIRQFSIACRDTGTMSQLVFTTHDTSILNSRPLRDDEIWFVEKDVEGACKLFPLTDFKLPDKMNLRKAYLEGRFGGVPYLTAVDIEV